MFDLRSARGRAVLASAVLVLIVAVVACVAILRVRQHQERLLALEETAAAVAALEHARAQFYLESVALAAFILSQDEGLIEDYHAATAALDEDLALAEAESLARGDTDDLAVLHDLAERRARFEDWVEQTIPFLLAVDPATAAQLGGGYTDEMWAEVTAIVANLDQLAESRRNELAASRATASDAAEVTSWIVLGFGGGALLVATGVVVVIIASVVRPLSSLRASARAITSGDLEARAKVSGPEEVASLACDFNAMTHALAAKTKEYIDTTNLTGDLIARLDEHGRWVFLNDAACQFYGKSREELVGTDSAVFMHPEDVEPSAQGIRDVRAGKELKRGFVNRQVTPMGTRVVEWNGSPLFDEDGQYAGIQITGRDITERQEAEKALRNSEERFREVAEASREWIWERDAKGHYTYSSPSVRDILGYESEEVVGKHFFHFVAPEETEGLVTRAREILASKGTFFRVTVSKVHKDGHIVVVESTGRPILDAEGNVVGYRGVDEDITERKRAEEAIRRSEERYRLLAENASDVIWTMDLSLRYTYVSPSITRLRGYSVEEIMASTAREALTPASLEVAKRVLAEELAKDKLEHEDPSRSRTVELEFNCKDGSTVWTEVKLTALRDPDGHAVGIMGVTRDISERKKAEAQRETLHAELEVRAITDGLTDLYNHAHFYQRLAEEIERSKRYERGFAVVMMDVDNFKQYNDSRGHQAGDEALCLISDCIRKAVRRSDTAFRYGGDEFAAILAHADSSKARTVVDRINRRIGKSLKELDDSAGARLSLSAGVACFPDDGTTTDDLVRTADGALYSAKWLARARDIMKQQVDIESLLSASTRHRVEVQASAGRAMPLPEALQEQRTAILSSVAGSLALALKEAGVTEAHEDPDLQVVAVVAAAAEMKDRYIRGHPERTSELAVTLGQEMGLPPERVRDIRIAGLLHDIGKVSVSESILNKPGKLTKSEFAMIKDHPIVGATLVSQVRGLGPLAPIIRHHHERFDGNGYPDGLAGEDIPLEARILSVADVFDAMTHQRAYRKALSKEQAVAELECGAGTQFDPAMVEAFLALVKRQGEEPAAPAQAASEGRQLAAARAPGQARG